MSTIRALVVSVILGLTSCNHIVASSYEAAINLPNCDVSNKDVFWIQSVGDWAEVNNPRYRIFCVLPGDYTQAGVIRLTESGRAQEPRWIRWYDPDKAKDVNTHPVRMPISQQAIIKQVRLGSTEISGAANYWIIDRLVIRGSVGGNWIGHGSSNNVLNRLLIEEGESTYLVFDEAKNNVLQNSVLRNTKRVPHEDRSLIYFSRNEGARIINNDLYNAAGSGVEQGPQSLSNHIVYGNNFYVTPEYYSDCNGNLDPAGNCACTEMGVVLKGSTLSDKLFRIEHNVFWGFRPTDSSCGGTGSPGSAVDLGSGGFPVRNVIINDNMFYDVPNGIYLGLHIDNVRITGNLIYKIHNKKKKATALSNLYGASIDIYTNTIVDADYWYRTSFRATNTDMQCNVIIDSPGVGLVGVLAPGSQIRNNYFYNATVFTDIHNHSDFVSGNAKDTRNTELCFNRHIHTREDLVCVPYATTSVASPHYNCSPTP